MLKRTNGDLCALGAGAVALQNCYNPQWCLFSSKSLPSSNHDALESNSDRRRFQSTDYLAGGRSRWIYTMLSQWRSHRTCGLVKRANNSHCSPASSARWRSLCRPPVGL